jgi:hypothetical protein
MHYFVLAECLLVFSLAGLHRSRLSMSLHDDFSYIVAAIIVGFALKVTLYGLVPIVDPPPRQVVHALVLFSLYPRQGGSRTPSFAKPAAVALCGTARLFLVPERSAVAWPAPCWIIAITV